MGVRRLHPLIAFQRGEASLQMVQQVGLRGSGEQVSGKLILQLKGEDPLLIRLDHIIQCRRSSRRRMSRWELKFTFRMRADKRPEFAEKLACFIRTNTANRFFQNNIGHQCAAANGTEHTNSRFSRFCKQAENQLIL